MIPLISRAMVDPRSSVRSPENVSRPGLWPGASVPPDWMVVVPPMVPEPLWEPATGDGQSAARGARAVDHSSASTAGGGTGGLAGRGA